MPLGVLLGGVLLHSMNMLVTATLLPSIVTDVGGANLMSWPTTAFVASSIVAADGYKHRQQGSWEQPGVLWRRGDLRR